MHAQAAQDVLVLATAAITWMSARAYDTYPQPAAVGGACCPLPCMRLRRLQAPYDLARKPALTVVQQPHDWLIAPVTH
jgi:hypothetical protein